MKLNDARYDAPYRAIQKVHDLMQRDLKVHKVDFTQQAPAYHLSQAELAIFRLREGTVPPEEACILAAMHLLCCYETDYIRAKKRGETDGK